MFSLRRTWPCVLASSLYAKARGGASASSDGDPVDQEDADESETASGTASDAPGSGTVNPNKRKSRVTNSDAPVQTSMDGGRRRKVVRKK